MRIISGTHESGSDLPWTFEHLRVSDLFRVVDDGGREGVRVWMKVNLFQALCIDNASLVGFKEGDVVTLLPYATLYTGE